MTTISSCPICGNKTFQTKLTCIDHTVTKEQFNIQSCTRCNFYLTNPQPSQDQLGKYYESPKYISHASKSRSIVDIIYRISRRFTINWKIRIVTHNSKSVKSLLDYGCGTGDFLEALSKKQIEVSGVEPSTLARTQALEKNPGKVYESIDQIKTRFDAITLTHSVVPQE